MRFNSPEHIEALNKFLGDDHARAMFKANSAKKDPRFDNMLRAIKDEKAAIARAETEQLDKDIQAIIKPYIKS